MSISETKICTKCGVEKNLIKFGKNRATKDGLQYTCKACMKKYRIDNRDIIQAQRKQYRIDHCDEIRKQRKQYRIDNHNKILEQKKQYRLNNRDKIIEKGKQYRLNNHDEILKKEKQYRIDNRIAIQKKNRRYRLNNSDRVRKCRHRMQAKRRGWKKPQPINYYFEGAHLHHLHLNGNHRIALYIPSELHMSIPHAYNKPDTMKLINQAAFEWLVNKVNDLYISTDTNIVKNDLKEVN